MRPRGRPPTPSARSRPSEPVETVSISTARSRWPSFMTEPLPKARSICPIAASRARCRSPESRLREVASSAISPRPRCSLCCLAPYTPAAARVEALVEEPQELCLLVASVAHECGDLVPAAMCYLLYHPSAQEQTKDSSVLGGARHGSSVPGMPGHRKGESSERLCALGRVGEPLVRQLGEGRFQVGSDAVGRVDEIDERFEVDLPGRTAATKG